MTGSIMNSKRAITAIGGKNQAGSQPGSAATPVAAPHAASLAMDMAGTAGTAGGHQQPGHQLDIQLDNSAGSKPKTGSPFNEKII